MKTVRLLLAALSLATLAACGTQSVTGPDAGARRGVTTTTAPSTGTTIQSATSTTCEGTLVVSTDASGAAITTCTARGPVVGSGS
ncbi:MAG TPA: hypothetical protein VF613_14770 [Longimicrobium sp.]|jgi:hypothetical protein